ncbi:pogo transposable element with ZNF domain isoform X5 [Syngnathus typhle]|uniref:pogo transposable element with ZNF domain isoform X5 n=1 Tax=Syngnathus typhle TaxID=161592 RepID=UPI002A6A657A|nr:pogo transposable element with ZNF domain isoform X5 [Syngnathus typhle]
MANHSDVSTESEEELSCDEDEEEDPPSSTRAYGRRSPELSGARLGFSLNGRHIPPLPAGGAMELKLHFHPSGSSSGFVTVRAASPSLSACAADIRGAVLGQAAQPVFKEPQNSAITQKTLLHSSMPGSFAGTSKDHIPKGLARPLRCTVCISQYKLVSELRGFVCFCSPVVAESLTQLKMIRKKKNDRKRHRNRAKNAGRESVAAAVSSAVSSATAGVSRTSSPRPAAAAAPSDPSAGPARCPDSPQLVRPEPDLGKLVIMVDDFYYGRDPGGGAVSDHSYTRRVHTGLFHCLQCQDIVGSNIQLMSHLKTHIAKMAEEDRHMDSVSSCPHCFRRFSSSFKLECHVETVHTQRVTNAKCDICELDFATESLFLQHMKNTHKAGEMPYVCQVCNFRSSFYSDVWSHFEEFHADTKNLLCPYCLKVLHSSAFYFQHFARHQRKFVFSCKKCRLHFLYGKERQQHHDLHHGSHITPTQVTGLKPGTKVTVRTYSVVAGAKCEEDAGRMVIPCKVVDVEAVPPASKAAKNKSREVLDLVLSNLSSEDEVSRRRLGRCLECRMSIGKLSAHFPSRVRCSLCPFATCCSTAYANHMIRDHTALKKQPHFDSMFRPHVRLWRKLHCASCSYVTQVGDQMAVHLAECPAHLCVMPDPCNMVGTRTEATRPPDSSCGVKSSGGAFVAIDHVQPSRASGQLSLKPLDSPYVPPSPAAMTIKFIRPQLPLGQEPVAAAPPLLPAAPLAATQESHLLAEWEWRVATWALIRHEQQLRICENVLLRSGARVPPESAREAEHHRRAVERLCRHLRPGCPGGRLPNKVLDMVMEKSTAFILSLCSRIQSESLRPGRVGFMDELSVFVDAEMFARRNGRAFRLEGSPAQTPLFDVVLSALSDGTFLPPMLFFRGAPMALPVGFPNNVLLEARCYGFTDFRRLQLWVRKVWCPRLWPYSKSLLLADVHRGHMTDGFKALLSAASTDVVLIPAGCSFRLQPLDVCVKPVLLNFLQVRWNQLVAHGGLEGLGLDQLALMLACWVSEVTSTLTSDVSILKRSFASVCHLQKEQTDAEQLIQLLTAKLNVPLELSKPPVLGLDPDPPLDPAPDPAPVPARPTKQVRLLLVVHSDQRQKKKLSQEDSDHPEMA